MRKLRQDGLLVLLLVVTGSIPQLIRGALGRVDFIYLFYNINICVELTILYFFFKINIKTRLRLSIIKWFFVFSLCFGLFLTLNEGFGNRFFNEWVCVNNIMFTGWILLLLLEFYERDELIISPESPIFWFVIGLFLYTSCTVLIFSLWNYIMSHENTLLANLWIIHDMFNTIMYLVFSYGLFLYNKKQVAIK